MARNAARLKLGYYPLVEAEAKRIRHFLRFPETCAALDPCAGTGRALQLIAGETGARLYGIELDSYRAAEATTVLDRVVQGSTFDAHSPVESYSLGVFEIGRDSALPPDPKQTRRAGLTRS